VSDVKHKTFTQEQVSIAPLIMNVVGIACYLFMASRGGWKIPEEQAQGINVTTGEPFIWAIGVFPIYALFFLMDLSWAVFILIKRNWKNGRLWLVNLFFWFVAVWIDFAHH
jgi:hypothetical protein